MDFTLLPDMTAFMIGFVIVAALSVALLVGTAAVFFAENRAVRVRRHESFFSYYGHLAASH
jgi:hypothetical protein